MKKRTQKHVIEDVCTKNWNRRHKLALIGAITAVFGMVFLNERSKEQKSLLDINQTDMDELAAINEMCKELGWI